MKASNPLRVLVVAVIRQAMLDYRDGHGSERMAAASFLATEGKEILEELGYRPSLIDDFLANPNVGARMRNEPSDRRRKR
jgi:hypothetical protein